MEGLRNYCPDCDMAIGEYHLSNCESEQCPRCGGQLLSCGCEFDWYHFSKIPWRGLLPGVAECREYGLYARLLPGKGWTPCAKSDHGATEDLKRLFTEGQWDIKKQKWLIKFAPESAAETKSPAGPKLYGHLLDPRAACFRTQIGSADVSRSPDDGKSYHVKIAISVGDRSPVISCRETGKVFILPWEDILYLAGARGLLES